MGSQLKKAHKTHALAQPAGVPYPHGAAGDGTRARRGDEAQQLFAELCKRVPDAASRSRLIGVEVAVDEAWRGGRLLPLLRTHRRSLAAIIRSLRADMGTDTPPEQLNRAD